MVYFDTSFIAPVFIEEDKSEWVTSKIKASEGEELVLSHWTRVEFASLLARRVRMKELTKSVASLILDSFEEVVSDSFAILTPTTTDFNLAQSFLQQHRTGLRAGDALHLAIAQNNNAKKFCTLDNDFMKAIKLLNIPISLIK